jgi:hypothetical protein
VGVSPPLWVDSERGQRVMPPEVKEEAAGDGDLDFESKSVGEPRDKQRQRPVGA